MLRQASAATMPRATRSGGWPIDLVHEIRIGTAVRGARARGLEVATWSAAQVTGRGWLAINDRIGSRPLDRLP